MLVGLACAVGASLCYGIGSVLQAIAAADTDSAAHLDPRLLLRLLKAWPYVLGLALDGAGFVLSLVALRSLPLYVVQAVVASFLAVTAVVGAVFLGTRVRMLEGVALAGVVLGLALVSLSAAPDSVRAPGKSVEWLVLAAGVVLTLVAVPLGRLSGAQGAWALGGVAGLAFGVVAVAARALLSSAAPGDLVPPVHVLGGRSGVVRPAGGRAAGPGDVRDGAAARQRGPGDGAPGGGRDGAARDRRSGAPGRPCATGLGAGGRCRVHPGGGCCGAPVEVRAR